MRNLCIKPTDIANMPIINGGSEGIIYRYDEDTIIKLYNDLHLSKNQQRKIEILSQKHIPYFKFAKGLTFVENYDLKKDQLVGENSDYVATNFYTKDFSELSYVSDISLKKEVAKKVSNAIEEAHKQNIIIGDLHSGNILIDENNNPAFIDTTNYMVDEFDFDTPPDAFFLYEKTFNKKCSNKDNDKFLLGRLCLEMLLMGLPLTTNLNPNLTNYIISNLNISNWSKECLYHILSDSHCKPYFSEIINEFPNNEPLLDRQLLMTLKKKFPNENIDCKYQSIRY